MNRCSVQGVFAICGHPCDADEISPREAERRIAVFVVLLLASRGRTERAGRLGERRKPNCPQVGPVAFNDSRPGGPSADGLELTPPSGSLLVDLLEPVAALEAAYGTTMTGVALNRE